MRVEVSPLWAKIKNDTDIIGKMDPYVEVIINGVSKKTQVHKSGGINPRWNDKLSFDARPNDNITMRIFDKDTFKKDDYIGEVNTSMNEVMANRGDSTRTYPFRTNKNQGELNVAIRILNGNFGQWGGMQNQSQYQTQYQTYGQNIPVNQSTVQTFTQVPVTQTYQPPLQSYPLTQSVFIPQQTYVEQPIQTTYVQQPMQTAYIEQPIQTTYVQQPVQTAYIEQPIQKTYVQQPVQTTYVQQPMQTTYVQQPVQTTYIEQQLPQTVSQQVSYVAQPPSQPINYVSQAVAQPTTYTQQQASTYTQQQAPIYTTETTHAYMVSHPPGNPYPILTMSPYKSYETKRTDGSAYPPVYYRS